jgi:C4-dicarboxylate transporter/malic acid transport protein
MSATASQAARVAYRRRGTVGRRPDPFVNIGPNWYAAVMGTGIVANAVMLEPVSFPQRDLLALAFWLLAAALLVVVTLATAAHWYWHPARARAHASNPLMAPFYGAPAMALLTVGAGTLLVGREVIGLSAAVTVDSVLWAGGTLGGLACSVAIPYLMVTRLRMAREQTSATWLMPVVPPMVSAATGAALLPYLAAGQDRLSLLLACYAMFGLSLIASLLVIVLVWVRLIYDGPGPAATVPTLLIVLGPLGQSITAVNLLAAAAPHAIGAPYSSALQTLGLLYGVPVWGFALLWLALAGAIILRTARQGLPFTLSWWSFTFPIGTFATGTAELARNTALIGFHVAAVALLTLLLIGWGAAAAGTTAGVASRKLLLDPTRAPAGDDESELAPA